MIRGLSIPVIFVGVLFSIATPAGIVITIIGLLMWNKNNISNKTFPRTSIIGAVITLAISLIFFVTGQKTDTTENRLEVSTSIASEENIEEKTKPEESEPASEPEPEPGPETLKVEAAEEEEEKEAKPETEKDKTDAYENLSEEDRIQLYITTAKIVLNQYFDEEHYEIKKSNDSVITVSVWQEGVVQEATMAKLGNDKYLKDWEEIKEIFKGTSKDFSEAKTTMGLENYIVMLNLVNDENHDNMLLSYANGTLIYDFVNAND